MNHESRAIIAGLCGVFVMSALASPQVQGSFPRMPASLNAAVTETDVIVRGRVVAVRNELYQARSTDGRIWPTHATVVTIELYETLRGAAKVKAEDGRIEARAMGYSDEVSRNAARLNSANEPPILTVGRECILFLFSNQLKMLWFQFGPQGAFEERNNVIESAEARGPSELAKAWKGRPWREFVKEVRERSAAAERRSKK